MQTTEYFETAPEVFKNYEKNDRYKFSIYFFNIMILFRYRWKNGLTENGFKILDGGLSSLDSSTFSIGDNVCVNIRADIPHI